MKWIKQKTHQTNQFFQRWRDVNIFFSPVSLRRTRRLELKLRTFQGFHLADSPRKENEMQLKINLWRYFKKVFLKKMKRKEAKINIYFSLTLIIIRTELGIQLMNCVIFKASARIRTKALSSYFFLKFY